jgi:hypothetical protein
MTVFHDLVWQHGRFTTLYIFIIYNNTYLHHIGKQNTVCSKNSFEILFYYTDFKIILYSKDSPDRFSKK